LVSPYLIAPASVLWVLTSPYIASATATLPRGRGPPMDFGRTWRDGQRVLGPSKTWSGFLFGTFFALPFALLQAWLVLIAPPNLAIVPSYGASVAAALPVALLLTAGAMTGDALGSFVKRRLGRPSGARTLFLDQLPFVLVPVLIGLVAFPATFDGTFLNPQGILWLVLFTLGFHVAFNWIGYRIGTKKVPW
jgi:CDP-2,3-bis-(O-geranylgeranyl)-sn-glycerol synthase